ncbi:MAG: 3-phosphoshikimate 1-carboxyvinyltransferase [Acidobacteriota bacterium]
MRIEPASHLRGTLRLPGDKSISHRYAILGAMAHGATHVTNYSPSQDCESTLTCLRMLGCKPEFQNGELVIESDGWEHFEPPVAMLDAGNSGTTIRLMSGVLAAQPFTSAIGGDDSLNRRPMKRIVDPLAAMGASIEARPGSYPPLTIHGRRLKGIRYTTPVASAQVKSCLLLAGVAASGTTTVIEKTQSRDHTERALPIFGVEARREGLQCRVLGGTRLFAARVQVPGDFSAAVYFILAALLVPGSEILIPGVGLNPTRTRLLTLLEGAGAGIEVRHDRLVQGEPVGDLRVTFSEEVGQRFPPVISGRWIPNLIDEIPSLAVLGTQLAKGFTVKDATELRKKESDRIGSIAFNLRELGLEVEESADGFHIPAGQTLQGGRVRTFGDHRIAMAFSLAGLIAPEGIELDDPDCVAISFPGFFQELARLGGGRESEASPIGKRHVFLVGFMASGKSTVGRRLGKRMGLPFLDLDSLIEEEQGTSINDLFSTRGEAFFRHLETRMLARAVAGPPCLLALGGGAFSSDLNREMVLKSGVSVWLKVPLELARQRCLGDRHRPHAQDPAQLERLFRQRQKDYGQAHLHIEVERKSPRAISAEIVRKIQEVLNGMDQNH